MRDDRIQGRPTEMGMTYWLEKAEAAMRELG
jgi:hypothetical protein